jgi:hypothetical protein
MDRVTELLNELNQITLNQFINNLSWKDIHTYKVKQPSGDPIYRHFVTIPQYYLKGTKDCLYRKKLIYGGRVDKNDINDTDYQSYVINKIKNKI